MNNSLTTLFDRLNKVKIRYFLLTDFECDLVGKDIDLFVDSDGRNFFEQILLGLGWYKRKEPSHHINHHFYYSPGSEIYLDVKYELTFAGGDDDCYTYLHTNRALSEATLNKKGVYRPGDIDAILLYAAHLAFRERGKLEQKHSDYLTYYIATYKTANDSLQYNTYEISNWLEKNFPGKTYDLQKILHPYFKHDQRRMVRSRKYIKYGCGFKVLFLGTDGAGKTTLIDAVEKKLNIKTRKIYLGTGENGWTSPLMKNIYNYRSKVKLFNKIFSHLRNYTVLPSEFILRILPVKIRSKYSVVLIDRFPGTFFLDHRSLRKFIYSFILPKPDVVFFIYADPKILLERKPEEVTLERSKADILKFQRVAEIVSGGNYVSVDTSNITIAEARDFIISEIYKSSKVFKNLFTTKLS